MAKVGIPRALFYYQYYPGWKAFFEELGAETVVSPPTDKAIFALGNARAVGETCLPVKIFLGHVIYLSDKCDYMFIPALRSLGNKAYNCSKFLGLPDMAKALIPECPTILDPEIDLSNGRHSLYQAISSGLGRYLPSGHGKVKKAIEAGREADLSYHRKMVDYGMTPLEAVEGIHRRRESSGLEQDASLRLKIALIGHPYVLYDDYINHRLVSRIEAMDVEVVTPEMASAEAVNAAMARLVGKAHWTFEADVIGAGEFYMEAEVDGLITVAVFACGPDSMMIDVVRHRARDLGVPFLHLTLDEHTSEGGIVTRLEAFLDMIRRKRGASDAPTLTNPAGQKKERICL